MLWPFEHRPAGKPLGSQLHLSAYTTTKKEIFFSDLGMTMHKYQKEKREKRKYHCCYLAAAAHEEDDNQRAKSFTRALAGSI